MKTDAHNMKLTYTNQFGLRKELGIPKRPYLIKPLKGKAYCKIDKKVYKDLLFYLFYDPGQCNRRKRDSLICTKEIQEKLYRIKINEFIKQMDEMK